MTTDVQAVDYRRTFPREVRMDNAKTLQLRLMGRADRDEIVRFAQALPKQDLLFLRTDITDPRMVDEWIAKADANRSVAILAYDGERLAGYATLHHDEVLWTRHVGEIRTNVGADYRGIRLGARLVEEMFLIAKEIGLKKITANMTSDQKAARATFERIGFRPEALLADHVVDAEGRMHDMLIMSYDVDGFND